MNSLTVDDLGKQYFLRGGAGKGKSAKAARAATLNLGFTRVSIPRPSTWFRAAEARELWALRHVTFAVRPGTILGIIGSNGAGKSTLLKVLARVIRPTEGRVVGRGRVVSLLELGAGFDQDRTARENIFMNAAMHGIPKVEVRERLDEIIAFAEVEKFLDSPLRHYSSGMYLRLAFSVAINMDPSILLADEILAVGDIAFQERCLERIAQAGKEGLTVLFVSHDMAAVSRLCDRVIWLNAGQVVQEGDPGEVVAAYQDSALRRTAKVASEEPGANIKRLVEVASVRLLAPDGRVIGATPVSDDAFIRVRLNVSKAPVSFRTTIDVYTKGIYVFKSVQPEETAADTTGTYDCVIRIPAHFLSETMYTVNVTVSTRNGKPGTFNLTNGLTFMVYGTNDPSLFKGGVVTPKLDWTVGQESPSEKIAQ